MNAADVRNALLGRWPPAQYLSIYEAPQQSDRQGRKLDVVVVSLWRSRGLEMDGVEIKVSMSDWKRELDEPDKADWWHQRVHRFWIAAPADLAKKIKPQLPVNWGLLSVGESGVRVSVTPELNREPIPLAWPETVGLLRATADTGVNVLARERQIGWNQGVEHAEKMAAYDRPESTVDGRKLAQVEMDRDRAVATIKAFEEASGLTLSEWGRHDAGQVGRLVKLVQESMRQGPGVLASRMQRAADDLRSVADETDRLTAAVVAGFSSDAASTGADGVEHDHEQDDGDQDDEQ